MKLLFARALAHSRKNGHRRVFLELFAGKGGISTYVERRGIGAIRVELLSGVDCCKPEVIKLLLGWIHSGVICAAWLGTPCSTWSRARRDIDGHGPRSKQYIYGYPGLSEVEMKRLADGNLTMKVSCQLIRALNRCGTPTVLENPSASLLWSAPPLQPLLTQGHRIVIDYCSYGTRWRKRTAFHAFNLASAHSLGCTCRGRRGKCSFSGLKHQLLSGYDKVTKQRWTKIAEPYPMKLCKDFAKQIVSTVESLSLSQRHSLFDGHP